MAERRKCLTLAEGVTALEDACDLAPETDMESSTRVTRDALALARLYSRTSYDAVYLELAMRKKAKLATMGTALIRAAAKIGVLLVSV